ncbi:thiamine-phosphate kinase [Litoribacillus peritrichatus]|uniref:Thiamine-monophosphate kinase n=1 Tax=Litoribacillus peritrichatus TaxID=718191 RepID=A0ABP7M299_9GAMM
MDEFALIQKFFHPLQGEDDDSSAEDFILKIGDDAAVWKGQGNLAFSIDTLVEGVHFTPDIPPEDLGYRVLAVNLSDLAAMAATPSFFTLAITLPEANPVWLEQFAQGMKTLAVHHGIALVGGDTTRGPLTITVQVHGDCPKPIKRSGACVGDDVYVTGFPGDAASGLKIWLDKRAQNLTETEAYLVDRFHRPTPRVELAQQLAPYLNSMLDVSDGLVSDLGHIAKASDVDLQVQVDWVTPSDQNVTCVGADSALKLALTGGDDYELAFTAPQKYRQEIADIAAQTGLPVTLIGRVHDKAEADRFGRVSLFPESYAVKQGGYNHF